jgi:hypothetical protein
MPKPPAQRPPKPVMVSATFMAEAEAHVEALCAALKLDRTKDQYVYSRLDEAVAASKMRDEDLGRLAEEHNDWCASAKAQMYSAICPWVQRDTQLTL